MPEGRSAETPRLTPEQRLRHTVQAYMAVMDGVISGTGKIPTSKQEGKFNNVFKDRIEAYGKLPPEYYLQFYHDLNHFAMLTTFIE